MTGRSAIFKVPQDRAGENEKLVELFKNRAELKKEFAALRKEQYRLQQCVREQQGATARVSQKLEHLESLLIDPEWMHTVVVFYQLRALNRRCKRKLAKFAEQLKQQRECRQRDRQLAVWREGIEEQSALIRQKLDGLRTELHKLDDRLQSERRRMDSMSGIARVFRNRGASGELEELAEQVAGAQRNERELVQELQAIENRAAPDPEGLDVAAKRSINFMIIAFAQQLYLQFRDARLVSLVKESGDKSVGAINYGSKAECDALLELIRSRVDAIDNVTDFADALQRRCALIAEHAVYKNDDDAVPIAGAVATVFAIDANGRVREKDANLLGENYWGLADVLSR